MAQQGRYTRIVDRGKDSTKAVIIISPKEDIFDIGALNFFAINIFYQVKNLVILVIKGDIISTEKIEKIAKKIDEKDGGIVFPSITFHERQKDGLTTTILKICPNPIVAQLCYLNEIDETDRLPKEFVKNIKPDKNVDSTGTQAPRKESNIGFNITQKQIGLLAQTVFHPSANHMVIKIIDANKIIE